MGSSHTLDQLDSCFDDTHAVANADLLRCGATSQVLGHRVMAPSTLGPSCAPSPSATSAGSTGAPSRS